MKSAIAVINGPLRVIKFFAETRVRDQNREQRIISLKKPRGLIYRLVILGSENEILSFIPKRN